MNYLIKKMSLLTVLLGLLISCGGDVEECDTRCTQEAIFTSPPNAWIAIDVETGMCQSYLKPHIISGLIQQSRLM